MVFDIGHAPVAGDGVKSLPDRQLSKPSFTKPSSLKLLPRGTSNFRELIDEGSYFVDKTRYIKQIEESRGKFLFMVRPRRFGKSIFLSMLQTYYDVAFREQFDHYFAGTFIHSNRTGQQGTYQIISLDLSNVSGSPDTLEQDFNDVVGDFILDAAKKYQQFYDDDFVTQIEARSTAKNKLVYFYLEARRRGYRLCLMVDEYDNFTNMLLTRSGERDYCRITHGEGFYRDFFKVVKSGFSMIFLTGISPVTLDDLTSGFNIADNLTLDPDYNEVLGFSATDVREIVSHYHDNGLLAGMSAEDVISRIAPLYDNYCFSAEARRRDSHVYNSYMVTYYLSHLALKGQPPDNDIVPNTLIDYEKLRQVVMLEQLLRKREDAKEDIITDLASGKSFNESVSPSFPASEILEPRNFLSYLFYLGMVSVLGEELGMPTLGIPNSNVRCQYFDYIRQSCAQEVDGNSFRQVSELIKRAAVSGEFRPLAEKVVALCSAFSSNRQLSLREGLFQAWFMSFLLFNRIYEPVPELETCHGYSDILLFPRKGVTGVKHSYILELKYLTTDSTDRDLADARSSASDQLSLYANDSKITMMQQNTLLHKMIIIIKGFSLVLYEELGTPI